MTLLIALFNRTRNQRQLSLSRPSIVMTLIATMSLVVSCATKNQYPDTQQPTLPESNVVTPDTLTTLKPTNTKQSTIKPDQLTSWKISGAMAAKSAKKSWTASFHWSQQGPSQYQIRLIGPLGGGSALITSQNGMTSYRDGPKVYSSTNASKLLQEKTGIALPVGNLYYWVRGLPAKGPITSSKQDAQGHLSLLVQSGYTIEYLNYQQIDGMDLPQKIKLHGHNVSIKVAIKQWH